MPLAEGGDGAAALYTVFSAAAYPNGEGSNKGAILRLERAQHEPGSPPPSAAATVTPLSFELPSAHGAGGARRREEAVRRSLGALIRAHHGRLREQFAAHRPDARHTRIGITAWAAVMAAELQLRVDWRALQPALAPTIKRGGASGVVDTGLLDYERFLASDVVMAADGAMDGAGSGEAPRRARAGAASAGEVDRLYDSLQSLRAIVDMLDTNHNGVIDRQEFEEGFRRINDGRPAEEQLVGDPRALFEALDQDGSGEISMAEVTEAFRLTVLRDPASS